MNLSPRRAAPVAATVLALGAGCASPLDDVAEADLRRAVGEATRRELADAAPFPQPRTTERDDSVRELNITPSVMPELEKMAGPASYQDRTGPQRPDLNGNPLRVRSISLRYAMRRAAERNLQVQFARLAPAVSEAQVVAAEAAFDWTLFSNLTWAEVNEPHVASGFSTTSLSATSAQDQTVNNQTGLRKAMTTGGQVTIQQDITYLDGETPGIVNRPDPAGTTAMTFQIDQPLLRNAGSDVNTAEIRLAQNAERSSIANLRRDLIRTLTDTEKTYWELYRAIRDVQILQRSVERGIKVRDQVRQRRELDATPAAIADAAARVEERRANVLRGQTAARQISDRLKALVNDPEFTVGSEILVGPTDTPLDIPFEFSLYEAMDTAVNSRPEVELAILSIDDTSIRRIVADNSRLPRLDLRLQTKFSALDENTGDAYGRMLDGTFVNYLAGLVFEQPIGNRRAEADFRRRTLERQQAVISYANTVQQVVLEVKNTLDAVRTNYALIEQTRASRIAATERLRVYGIENEKIAGFSSERLNLELNFQDSLTNAERQEVQAIVDYNNSIADLYAAIGRTLEHNKVVFTVPSADDPNARTGAIQTLDAILNPTPLPPEPVPSDEPAAGAPAPTFPTEHENDPE